MNNTNYYIRQLNTNLDASLDFYEYQLMRYWNDTSIDLRGNWETTWRNIGFDVPEDSDLLRSAYTNVIKSVIDSLVSKLSNQKVRPYFTPVNGTWQTKKVVRHVQQYFDILFDNQKVNIKIAKAFKLACIMGKAYLYVNPITYQIEVLPAHLVSTLSSEERYGGPKRCMLRYLKFPVSGLDLYGIKTKEYYGRSDVTLSVYYDLKDKEVTLFVNGTKVKSEAFDHDVLPIVPIYYNDPVFGNNTTSVVQELDGIQTQIDFINSQISLAAQSTPINQTFVLEGSSLAPKDLDSKGGQVFGIKMPPGINTPPVVSIQPRMFDPQWQATLEFYIKQAYEIVGISQLSAMSKKPSGLDSGAALQTMEDIESDRFETQITHYVQAFIDVARTVIEIIDEKATILPEAINTSSLTWKDVKEQSDLFKVQYSAATALSKDPAEKIKQIMQMSQIGLIGPDKISRYLDMPDLEDAYKNASAIADGVDQCIERAIEEEDYEVPDWVSYQQLAQQITITQNELYSSLVGDKKKDKPVEEAIFRLLQLENNLVEVMEKNGYVETEETEAKTTEEGLGVAEQVNKAADITSTPSLDTSLANEPDSMLTGDVSTDEANATPNATPEVTPSETREEIHG